MITTNPRVCGVGRVPLRPPSASPVLVPTLDELLDLHVRHRVPWRLEEHQAWQGLADDVALERAMLGQDWRGLKHDHQYRVPNAALREAARLAAERWADFFEAETFEPIIATTREIQAEVFGLGSMWGYDSAERIAAHRGIVPEEFVYVQRGALVGARNLKLPVMKGRILYADLAPKLRVLSAGDIEDFLCLNKRHLSAGMLAE